MLVSIAECCIIGRQGVIKDGGSDGHGSGRTVPSENKTSGLPPGGHVAIQGVVDVKKQYVIHFIIIVLTYI